MPSNRGCSLALLTLLACGCSAPLKVAEPLTSKLGPRKTQTAFWYDLARRPVVCNDEAFHALLLFFDGRDAAGDYAGRVAALRSRGWLPAYYHGSAEDAADRGMLAAALVRGLGIRGGLTMGLTGVTPRYAVRALEYRHLYPPSSPNQTFSGSEWVAVLGRSEDYQRGNPADFPAAVLPAQRIVRADRRDEPPLASTADSSVELLVSGQPAMLNVLSSLSADLWWEDTTQPAAAPAAPPTRSKPAKLKAIVTGVEGDQAELRRSEDDDWEPAQVGMSVGERGEFRTGARSAIRFVIPPDQVYALDRQGSVKVARALYDGKKITTDLAMQQGRVRLDVAPITTPIPPAAPGQEPVYKIEEAGVEHSSRIASPTAALAVRGTKVSLYDEPGFGAEAVSLTGTALFENTRRQIVAFGGVSGKTVIRDNQTGAAQQALRQATVLSNPQVARSDFDTEQVALVLQRHGLVSGDVVSGDTRVTDAQLFGIGLPHPILTGALNFVLRWDGGPDRQFNDLNLSVFSPLHSAAAPDFVGNPPFPVSLTPGDPQAEKLRAELYPRTSRSGGEISKNSIGPEGLEFASWPKNYPVGNYKVVVYNLLDAVPAPTQTIDPVPYTIDVFLNKRILINTVTGSVGELQTSVPLVVPVPASNAAGAARAVANSPGPRRQKQR